MLDSSELRSGMLYLRDTRNIKQWQHQMQHYLTVNVHYFQIFTAPSEIFHIHERNARRKMQRGLREIVCGCACVLARARVCKEFSL